LKIIVDTREQHPLEFRKSKEVQGTVLKKLNVGDYSIEGYEHKIAIERKSPQDLFGTLGKGHKRFKREIERALDYDYFAIIVECPFTSILYKEFKGSHYSRMLGDVVIQICCTLRMKYNIDIIYTNNRAESISYIRHLFRAYLKMKNKAGFKSLVEIGPEHQWILKLRNKLNIDNKRVKYGTNRNTKPVKKE